MNQCGAAGHLTDWPSPVPLGMLTTEESFDLIQAMVSPDLEERMLPAEEPWFQQEREAREEEEDWENNWTGPLILLGLLVAGLIAAIVVSPPVPQAGAVTAGGGAGAGHLQRPRAEPAAAFGPVSAPPPSPRSRMR